MWTKIANLFLRSRKTRGDELIRHSRVRFLHYTPTLADSPHCSIYKNSGLRAGA